jgi:hypothetical protein
VGTLLKNFLNSLWYNFYWGVIKDIQGKGTTINYPEPPKAPTTAEAVTAYVESMPQMYETQMQYAPLLAQQQADISGQFAPEYAQQAWDMQQQYAPLQAEQQWQMQQQYAPLMAQQQQELMQEYEPEAYQARQQIGTMMEDPNWMTGYQAQQAPGFQAARNRLTQDTRGAWASRGLAHSGMSAEDEVKMMSEFEFPYAMQQEQLTLQEQGRRQQFAAGMAGRYAPPAIAGVQTPQTQMPQVQTPDMMQGYNFGGVAGHQLGGYSNYLNAWTSRQNALAQAQMQDAQGQGQLFGSLLGGGMNMLTAKIMFSCFAEDASIITSAGIKEIHEINEGDMVLGTEGFVKVVKVLSDINTPLELCINDVECTGQHPFIMADGSLRFAKDIRFKDRLYNNVIVTSIMDYFGEPKTVYNLEVEGHRYFVGTSMILVHDGREVA